MISQKKDSMSRAKKILVSVSNDLVTDQRVDKVCCSLQKAGFDVCLLGRQRKSSLKLGERSYKTIRMKLLFHSGPFFYLNFNLVLLWVLLKKGADIFLSNDLDTLPANYIASKLRRKPLVYDSHEYFTEVPELVNRKLVRKVWESIESFILPKVDAAYTVSAPIAEAYYNKYGIKMELIRNFPVLKETNSEQIQKDNIIIYQGAVNVHRGIEQMIEAMRYIDNAIFWIIGGGDIEDIVKEQIKNNELSTKVVFFGTKPFQELKNLTEQASIGISLEKPIGLNYTFALPNKVFDYIHAEVPVLASNLPELEKVFEKYKIGLMIKEIEPRSIAAKINEMLHSGKKEQWKAECRRAALEYNWQREEEKLIEIFTGL